MGLASIEGATNLAGVRNMRAFITTRLIDCFEQNIFLRGAAARRVLRRGRPRSLSHHTTTT